MGLKGFESLGFDAIYILNLPNRKDRRLNITNELLFNDVTTFEFIKNVVDGNKCSTDMLLDEKTIDPIQLDPNGTITTGMFGCALSHYNAWVELINSKHDNALILEDDIYIPSQKNTIDVWWDIIENELITIPDWDIVFFARLSGTGKNVGFPITKNIIKPVSSWEIPGDPMPWGAHAYAISKRAAQFMVNDYLPIWTPVDVYLDTFSLTNELNVYSTLYNQVFQRSQWIESNQQTIIDEVLSSSEFGRFNDSNIMSNRPNAGGFSALRAVWKNREAVATINFDNKVITFLTQASYDTFIKGFKSPEDMFKLYTNRGIPITFNDKSYTITKGKNSRIKKKYCGDRESKIYKC